MHFRKACYDEPPSFPPLRMNANTAVVWWRCALRFMCPAGLPLAFFSGEDHIGSYCLQDVVPPAAPPVYPDVVVNWTWRLYQYIASADYLTTWPSLWSSAMLARTGSTAGKARLFTVLCFVGVCICGKQTKMARSRCVWQLCGSPSPVYIWREAAWRRRRRRS